MATISANFTANFTKFYDAVEKAEVKLKDFGTGAETVSDRLEKLANSFTGRQIIQQAELVAEAVRGVGGVSVLTEKELARVGGTIAEASEKMRKLGIEVPASFAEITNATKKTETATKSWTASLTDVSTLVKGFLGLQVVQQVIGFGKEIIADADALTKLSAQTKISTDWLQKFQTGLDDAGGSIQDIATGMSTLQKRLGSNDAALAAAVKDLGLSVQQLRTMRPEEQFIAIADALHDIEDPARQAAVGYDIFGKAFTALQPLIEHGMDDIKDAAVGMSQDTVRALDEMGDAFTKMWRDVKAEGGGVIAFFYKALPAALDAVSLVTGQMHTRAMARAKEIEQLGKDIDKQLADIEKKRGKTGPGLPAALPPIAAPLDYEVRELEKSIEKLIATGTKNKEITDKQTKANSDARQSIVELEGVAGFYAGQIRSNLKLFEVAIDQQKGWIAVSEQAQQDNADIGKKIRAQSAAAIQADVRENSQFFDETFAHLKKLPDAFVGPVQQAQGELSKFADFVADELPKAIIGAIQGGGSISKTVGATLGNYLGKQIGAELGKTIVGTFAPMIGTAVGAYAGSAIGSLIDELASPKQSTRMGQLRYQLEKTAGGATKLAEQFRRAGMDIEKAFDVHSVQAFSREVERMQQRLKEQEEAYGKLDEAVERWGLTFEELGPALQKQRLHETAAQIYQDFKLLTGAGVDSTIVITRMADGLNKLVDDARTFGIALPAFMKGPIDKMAEMGLLTDAAGNKFGSAAEAGITFTEELGPVVKDLVGSIDKLVKSLQAYIDITNPATKAAAAFADELERAGRAPNNPNTPGTGHAQPRPAVASYQEGSGGFRNFGAGTLAMLHGWEAVVPRDDAGAAFATVRGAAPAAIAAGATTVVINAQGAFFDTPGDLQRLADKVNAALTAKFGLSTSMRAA